MPGTFGSEKPKRYSAVRYWRYIFTPLLLIGVVFGMFLLFTASDSQTASYNSLIQQTTTSFPTASAPFGPNVLQNLQRLSADPSSP